MKNKIFVLVLLIVLCLTSNVYASNNQEEFLSYFLLLSLKNPIDYFSILSKIKNNNVFKNSKKIKLVINISKCYIKKTEV